MTCKFKKIKKKILKRKEARWFDILSLSIRSTRGPRVKAWEMCVISKIKFSQILTMEGYQKLPQISPESYVSVFPVARMSAVKCERTPTTLHKYVCRNKRPTQTNLLAFTDRINECLEAFHHVNKHFSLMRFNNPFTGRVWATRRRKFQGCMLSTLQCMTTAVHFHCFRMRWRQTARGKSCRWTEDGTEKMKWN